MMDTGALLGVHCREGKCYNLKKLAEMERCDIAQREEDDFANLEKGASLSLEF